MSRTDQVGADHKPKAIRPLSLLKAARSRQRLFSRSLFGYRGRCFVIWLMSRAGLRCIQSLAELDKDKKGGSYAGRS
jgi:hypothetical protein